MPFSGSRTPCSSVSAPPIPQSLTGLTPTEFAENGRHTRLRSLPLSIRSGPASRRASHFTELPMLVCHVEYRLYFGILCKQVTDLIL